MHASCVDLIVGMPSTFKSSSGSMVKSFLDLEIELAMMMTSCCPQGQESVPSGRRPVAIS